MRNMKKWLSLALAAIMCLSATAALAETPAYAEAPYITNLGTYGAVADRLPKEPMVEDAEYLTIGTYGGELRRAADTGNWGNGKPIEEGLFRFKADGTVEPNVAKGYSVNEDYTVWTIYLREGMKWSDGAPFTAEDCVWFYNAVCKNKVDGKGVRACHKAGGQDAVVEKVDDYTFTVTFVEPKYNFPSDLTVDLKWHYAPKHIFEKMVQAIIDGDNETALAEGNAICGGSFVDVSKLGKELLYYFWNYPGVPTLNPYVLSTEEGKNNIKGEYYEYVRNPYYWKVDTAGQQLPYIDKIIGITVSNEDQKLMLLLDGTIDYNTVGMDAISTIRESETKINLYQWAPTGWGDTRTQVHFNLNVDDANLKALFNNKDFRQALSICVDREEFALLFSDFGVPGQAAPQLGALGYSEEWATQWTEYDVEKAKSLLEGCGLVMGADGFYDFADGTDFILNIKVMADMGGEETYKILEPYYRAAGVKCTIKALDRGNIDNDLMANAIECMLYPVTGIGDVSIDLKPNSMIPGTATNVAWFGNMTKETATGDLLKLIELNEEQERTGDPAKRQELELAMLKLHQENQWTLGYVLADVTIYAVNDRIKNFPDELVASDIYRDMGIAHCQCFYIAE